MLHYSFAISLNDDNDTINGEAVITIKFLQAATGFDLDLVKQKDDGKGMTVTYIGTGGMAVAFSQEAETLHLTSNAKAGEMLSPIRLITKAYPPTG